MSMRDRGEAGGLSSRSLQGLAPAGMRRGRQTAGGAANMSGRQQARGHRLTRVRPSVLVSWGLQRGSRSTSFDHKLVHGQLWLPAGLVSSLLA